MSAEVLASIEIPLLVNPVPSFAKDDRHYQRRPFTTKLDRHAKALLRAVQQEDPSNLQSLLDHGISPNIPLRDLDNKTTTALHLVIDSGKDLMTSFLLTEGADCDVINDRGLTPLDVACKKRNFRIIEMLINHGASLVQPSTRVACLGLTFFNLMSPHEAVTSWDHVTSDLDPRVMENAMHLAYVILDNGFARGWNGINCSFTYLNRVYNRHKNIFLFLLQAANDCQDENFAESCFGVLYRRRDADTLLKLHQYGYTKMVADLKRNHKHTGPEKCRFAILSTPSPLQALCRIKIRQTLRQNTGPISHKLEELDIPKFLKNYLDFMNVSRRAGKSLCDQRFYHV